MAGYAEKRSGPDYDEARKWTERQVAAGKLDLASLQEFLFATNRLQTTWTPGRFDQATFDAIVKLQTDYRDMIRELGGYATSEMRKAVSRIDGMAGPATFEMIRLQPDAVAMLERKRDMFPIARTEEPERRARRVTEAAPPVTRGPEQLTEEAALARIRRVVERGWARCTIEAGATATWEVARDRESTHEYKLRFDMPDGQKFELIVHSSEYFSQRSLSKTEGRDALRKLVMAALENYGETGELRPSGTMTAGGNYALVTSAGMIERNGDEHELYSWKEGTDGNLRRTRPSDSETEYIVHLARALKPYDKS